MRWTPPEFGTLKINVDGSSLGNPGNAGFEGVICDHLGRWVLGFNGSIGVGTNILVELQAFYHGLCLSWQQGWRSVVFESDLLEAINFINTTHTQFHLYGGIICDIRNMLRKDCRWRITMSFVKPIRLLTIWPSLVLKERRHGRS